VTGGADDTIPIGNDKGNPWAQQWGNIADLTIPYPDASSVDVTSALNDQVSNMISDTLSDHLTSRAKITQQ
jgi:hypothetical protein